MLAQLRTARFDRPLTYAIPAGVDAGVGDVVRVPLGPRSVFGFVVTPPRDVAEAPANIRPLSAVAGVPRAFDAVGLGLAQWMADAYLCTLGEALSAVVLAAALPRVVDRFVPVGGRPPAERFARIPARLLAFLWDDCTAGFTLDALLRHPEVRRAGDRAAIRRHIATLAAGGVLERRRTFEVARVGDAAVRFLAPGAIPISGKKAAALVALVRDAGQIRRSEALLAGFSEGIVRRAIAAGAVVETQRVIHAERNGQLNLPAFEPTEEQTAAIAAIDELIVGGAFGELLLHGITGSGKTFVYLATIAKVLTGGGRAIVLVPEIALTPQTAKRFEDAFGERVAVLHSGLSDRERYDAWQAAARGDIAVVVGARSAVFAPLPAVRLIVVDEAHESSYKQDSVPRYHAVAVARERMRRAGGVVVLGSATPALEDYARARAGRLPLVRLRERATAQALPRTHVIDMSAEFAAGNRRIFSTPLLTAIEARLERREKTVLFVNRRGSARFMLCRSCGYVPQCARCSVSLTVHRDEELLRCHYCDAQMPLVVQCPKCGDGPIREFGVGTQRIAHEIAQLYPHASIVRMDSDTTTRIGDHARLLAAFGDGGDVLVGTQMVAKGLDFPTVTLVGVVAADLDLHIADFRSAERTFGLVTQACGRSGRARPGEAFVQTYSPEHPAIVMAARHDYDGFASGELRERRALGWPPYARLVYLGVVGRDHVEVEATIEDYAALLRDDERWVVLGPAPYPIARLNDEWRFRLALKTRVLPDLRAAIRERVLTAARKRTATRLIINVDP